MNPAPWPLWVECIMREIPADVLRAAALSHARVRGLLPCDLLCALSTMPAQAPLRSPGAPAALMVTTLDAVDASGGAFWRARQRGGPLHDLAPFDSPVALTTPEGLALWVIPPEGPVAGCWVIRETGRKRGGARAL